MHSGARALTSVTVATSRPAIAAKADLNWRVGQTSVGAIGKTQTQDPLGKANVRSDNGTSWDRHRPYSRTTTTSSSVRWPSSRTPPE